MVFLLGMLVVTGVEFVKGSSIAGTPGTSVGGVFEPVDGGRRHPVGRPDDDGPQARSTKERATPSATPQPSATVTPTRSATPTTTAPAGAPGPVVSGTAG